MFVNFSKYPVFAIAIAGLKSHHIEGGTHQKASMRGATSEGSGLYNTYIYIHILLYSERTYDILGAPQGACFFGIPALNVPLNK